MLTFAQCSCCDKHVLSCSLVHIVRLLAEHVGSCVRKNAFN